MNDNVKFGITASAVGEGGESDATLYRDLIEDVALASELGYSTAWMIEHHFSNYFPTPNPLIFLSHLAARFPEMGWGTSALVSPWHDHLRLAEEISMVANLTKQDLYLGFGRGMAKLEYDAFGLQMDEGQDRFAESLQFLKVALGSESVTFDGKYYSVNKPISLRPRVVDPSRIHLYGALGRPESAEKIGRLGVAPLSRVTGPVEAQAPIIANWRSSFIESNPGAPVPNSFPIQITTIIEDTMDEALAQAQTYVPKYMQAQVDHYTPDETDWEELPSYKGWKPQFEGMKRMTDPANIPPWTNGNFVGTPEHVAGEVRKYLDVGFNHFLIQTATPGVPLETRRRWWKRFATEVMPEVSNAAILSPA
jgi:alkanesulfonate monooxygenase SsuD/methylene tetrahydromethanopterin reductase-like flavin-dependent oxidoreductase (luciferase family)